MLASTSHPHSSWWNGFKRNPARPPPLRSQPALEELESRVTPSSPAALDPATALSAPRFEANLGQSAAPVNYLARSQGYSFSQTPTVTASSLTVYWRLLPGKANDIGVGFNNSVWVIGADAQPRGFGIYHWNGAKWDKVAGGAVRIAVARDGNPWIVNNRGEIFRYDRGWQKMPGLATDIGIGANNMVWITGKAPVAGGYNIYHWNIDNWANFGGGAVRIAVAPDGTPWVVNNRGEIFRYDHGWQKLPGLATDIGIGAKGSVWITGRDRQTGGFGIYHWNGSKWDKSSGAAVHVAVDQGGSPWVVNDRQQIFASASPGGFHIDLIMTGMTASQQAILRQAAARWEQVIIGDLLDVVYMGQAVDDLLVNASAAPMDGPGNILGKGGPDTFRVGSWLPCHGTMKYDSADLAAMESKGKLLPLMIHELGHVLGFGTIWTKLGLLSGSTSADPRFTGAQATAVFNQLFGRNDRGVPVENNQAPEGTRLCHWREAIFKTEAMTGWMDPGANPLSRMTITSMADLGYQVNLNAADAYRRPPGVAGYHPQTIFSWWWWLPVNDRGWGGRLHH